MVRVGCQAEKLPGQTLKNWPLSEKDSA